MEIAASIAFGGLAYLVDDTYFIIVAISIKAVQGCGDAIISTAIFSIIAIEYP